MTLNGHLVLLADPRLWVALVLFVSQIIPPSCCCRFGKIAIPAGCCCCEALPEEHSSKDVVSNLRDANETLPCRPCRCNKIKCAGTKPEFCRAVDQRAKFDSVPPAIAPTLFNTDNDRPVASAVGRQNVIALRSTTYCAVLCRRLC